MQKEDSFLAGLNSIIVDLNHLALWLAKKSSDGKKFYQEVNIYTSAFQTKLFWRKT